MPREFDDLEAIGNPHRLVHLNMTEEMRHYRYQILKDAGYNASVSRRARDWHTRDFESLLALSPIALATSSILPGWGLTPQTSPLTEPT